MQGESSAQVIILDEEEAFVPRFSSILDLMALSFSATRTDQWDVQGIFYETTQSTDAKLDSMQYMTTTYQELVGN